VPLTAEYTNQVGKLAHDNGLLLHLDGARIFNAAVALNTPVEELTAAVDSVTFCLSKGLCAPVGSVLCGNVAFIRKARRIRKQLGGGMRQAGVLAAAGILAINEMAGRLSEDHRRARALAEGLAKVPGVCFKNKIPPSNMVFAGLEPSVSLSDEEVLARLKSNGILVDWSDQRLFRLVTHYWINDDAIEKTILAFQKVLASFNPF
jgi:threonine aldolase